MPFYNLDNPADRQKLKIDPQPLVEPKIIFSQTFKVNGLEVVFILKWTGVYHELWYEDQNMTKDFQIFSEDILSERCEEIIAVKSFEYEPGIFFRLYATLKKTGKFIGQINGIDFTNRKTYKQMRRVFSKNLDQLMLNKPKIYSHKGKTNWSDRKIDTILENGEIIKLNARKLFIYLGQPKFRSCDYCLFDSKEQKFVTEKRRVTYILDEHMTLCQKFDYVIQIFAKEKE